MTVYFLVKIIEQVFSQNHRIYLTKSHFIPSDSLNYLKIHFILLIPYSFSSII